MKVVLDAYGFICWLLEEFNHEIVEDYLVNHEVFMSAINFGEVHYRLIKKGLKKEAEDLWENKNTFPIKFFEPTWKRIKIACELKGNYPISYADAFCIGLAQELEAPVITGDPEFKIVKNIKLIWIGTK